MEILQLVVLVLAFLLCASVLIALVTIAVYFVVASLAALVWPHVSKLFEVWSDWVYDRLDW